MAIKMRVLCYTGKQKLQAAAQLIKSEYDLSVNAVDVIPPAYSCNNERVVILILSYKDKPDDTLRRFLIELTKARAQNVAIIADGKETGLEKIIDYLNQGGANVIDNVLKINVGLFSGKLLNEEETEKIKNWTKEIIEALV